MTDDAHDDKKAEAAQPAQDTAKVELAKPASAPEPVAPAASAPEAASTPTASGVSRLVPGKGGLIAAALAAAALLVASIGASVWLYTENSENEGILAAQEEARAAACAYAPVLAQYDAKNLDSYFEAVLAGATGDWKKQFDDTSKELKEVLSQGQVVSVANDVQCAIKEGDETSAEAIVVIGQTITSLGTQGQPAPGQLSMVMRMEKTDGKWLVNKVNSPLAPTPAQ